MLLYVYISKYIFWLYISIYTHISLYSNKYMYFFLIYIYIYQYILHIYIYSAHTDPQVPCLGLRSSSVSTSVPYWPCLSASCAVCAVRGWPGDYTSETGRWVGKNMFVLHSNDWMNEMKMTWNEMNEMKWNGMEWNDSMVDWMNECMIAWMNDWMNEWWYIVMIVIGVWWE